MLLCQSGEWLQAAHARACVVTPPNLVAMMHRRSFLDSAHLCGRSLFNSSRASRIQGCHCLALQVRADGVETELTKYTHEGVQHEVGGLVLHIAVCKRTRHRHLAIRHMFLSRVSLVQYIESRVVLLLPEYLEL